MRDPREVEFAACLLEIGGPPLLMVKSDGVLVSKTGYMFTASRWYERHIEPPPTTPGETTRFTSWWLAYKQWIWENRHA